MQFLFLWQESHSSTYLFTFFIIPGHQKFLVTSSTVFYCPSYPSTGTYTFPSLYIMLSTSLYFSSLNIFTPACFISLTAFTTLLSFTFNYLTFSSRFTPSTITSTFFVFLTFSHSSFTNVSSSLSFSTPTS